MSQPHYNFNWTQTDSRELIEQKQIIAAPTPKEVATLVIDPEGKKASSFAKFVEPDIPYPWDFDKLYQYAYSLDGQAWYALKSLTPWIWDSRQQTSGWLVPYGLNSALIKMLIRENVDLSCLQVARWRK